MKRVLVFRLALVVLFFLCAALILAALPKLMDLVQPVSGLPESLSAEQPPPVEKTPLTEKEPPSGEEVPPPPPADEPDSPAPEPPSSAAAEEQPLPPAEQPASSVAEGPVSSGAEQPAAPAEESPASTPEPPPPPAEEQPERPVTPPKEGEEWALRLVNWQNPLPMDFEPEYEAVQNRFVMDKRVAPIARQMIADAWAQGVTLVVNSAYRPYSAQQRVYNTRFQQYLDEGRSEQEARWLTDSYVAAPGCSEHQLGLAMDIVAAGEGEGSGGWLAAHAPDYGFILRYPADKTEITHTAYESWHYRYVGVTVAREITARGLCLEEYLAKLEEAAG